MTTTHSLLALSGSVAILTASLLLVGCSGGGGGGCTKDSDCKGDRVCAKGECVELPKKATENPAGPAVQAPNPTAQGPSPQPVPVPAAAPAYAADGLPAEIPAPGSPPPSVDEWNAVTREVTVKGSSKLNCETKMLREWLRVSCRKNPKGDPVDVAHKQQSGQQAFKFVGNGLASVVVQVVRAKTYTAQYTWDRGGARSGAELTVRWAPGAPRPEMFFTES